MKYKILTLEFDEKNVIMTLDDESKKVIPLEAFLLDPLVQGQLIDDKRLKKIDQSIEEQDAYKYAITLLAKQAYSSYSLKNKLVKKYSEETISKVIKRLEDNHLLNDKQYIISYFENRQQKAWSTSRIVYELEEMGFNSIDESIINEFSAKDLDACIKYARYYMKNHPKLESLKLREKLYQQLKNRGFDDEIVSETFKKIGLGILFEY